MEHAWTQEIQTNLKSENLDKMLLGTEGVNGMDSTGLAYEWVAESFEIGNGLSGITLDGESPEQQLRE